MATPTPIDHKETRLSIRASDTQKAVLRQAARVRRMKTSHFVLQASLDAAQSILVDQTEFQLSPEQWDEFCARLDAPPKEIPALTQLFSEPDPYAS